MSDEINMTIPIPADDDGYVLLQCEQCGTYFKATKVGIDMGIDEKNIYNVTVQKCQAIIANDNSSVTATTNIGATAHDIEQLIAAVRTKMDTLTSDEDKEATFESLEVIEAEVISEKPKKSMIKTAIASLQAIKGTVEFGSAVAALIQFVGPMPLLF